MVREDSTNLNAAMELLDNLGGYVRRFQVILVGDYLLEGGTFRSRLRYQSWKISDTKIK